MAMSSSEKWLAGILAAVFVFGGLVLLAYIFLFSFVPRLLEHEPHIVDGTSPVKEWGLNFNISESTEGHFLVEDDGEYLMAGITRVREYWEVSESRISPLIKRYLAFMKTDQDGEILWSHVYDIPVKEVLSVIKSKDNGFAIAGKRSGTDETFILKTNAGGEKEYLNIIDTEKSREIAAGVPDGDGFIFITGRFRNPFTYGTSPCSDDHCQCGRCVAVFLMRTDFQGEVSWKKTVEELESLQVKSFTAASRGGYIIAGAEELEETGTQESGRPDVQFVIYKLDNDGRLEWEKVIVEEIKYSIKSAVEEVTDGFLVAFSRDGYFQGNLSTVLAKVDNKGRLLWETDFPKHINKVFGTVAGGCIVVGKNDSMGLFKVGEFPYIAELDSRGGFLWEKTLDSSCYPSQDHFIYAIGTSGDDFLVTGKRSSFNDPYLVKMIWDK